VCSEGTLHNSMRMFNAEYRGEGFAAGQAGAFCDACGDGIVYDDPSFDAKWDEFRARVDKDQAEELAAYRANLGITQEVASRLSGGGHNAFSRYERQEAQPVVGVVALFRILNDLITCDSALLKKYVPEAKPLSGMLSTARSAEMQMAHSLQHAALPRVPVVHVPGPWPVVAVAGQARVTVEPVVVVEHSAGFAIIPDLHISAGHRYDVDVFEMGHAHPHARGKWVVHRDVNAAAEVYGEAAQGEDEEEAVFVPPLLAQLAKAPRPVITKIKLKPQKKAQTA
jgi:HTH-type transcriptional regulator / antitoxin MqsA